MNLLKCLSPAFTPGPLPQVFILPLVDYCDVVWNNCTQHNSSCLQFLFNYACRLVLHRPCLSYSAFWKELGLSSLCCCRKLHLAELTCHISVTPPYLPSSYVSQPTTTTHEQKSCQSSYGQDDIWAIHICICWCFPLVLSTCLITRIWTPMGNFQDLHIIILTHTMTSECLIIHAMYTF